MNNLDDDHELYKLVSGKLPGQKKILKGFKEKQKEAIDYLNEYKEHYEKDELYQIDFARIKKMANEIIDGYEKDILNFEGHIADIEKFIEVYDREYK
jgi:hypothetical protein